MAKSTRWVFGIGAVFVIVGFIAWIMQLTGGLLGGSGMTNIFLWGLMIAIFAFLVGFGAGSQIMASIIYIRGKEEMKGIARIGAVLGFACVAAAGVAILIDLGAIRNVLYMVTGLNPHSPLAWDMIAITVFIILSAIQVIAIWIDSKRVKIWAILAGIAAVVLQVVEGLLFATQGAHAWWNSPIMPIDFLVVAFVSGAALLLLIACVKGEAASTLAWLSRVLAIAIIVHLVLALIELLVMFIEGSPESMGVLQAIGSVIWIYLAELILPLIAAIILLTTGRGGKKKPCMGASILAIIGIFAHRLMLLYPSYNAPSLYLQLTGTDVTTGAYPISTGRYLDWDVTFALGTPYAPAGLEWLAALLPIGFAMVVAVIILLLMKRYANNHPEKA